MVLIVAKWEEQEDNQFIIQTITSALLSEVRAHIAEIFSLRNQIRHRIALMEKKMADAKGDQFVALQRAIGDAKASISKSQVTANVVVTKSSMDEMLTKTLAVLIEASTEESQPVNPDRISLWWAKKELQPDQPLSKYVGTNERTKIVVYVYKKSEGNAPPPLALFKSQPVETKPERIQAGDEEEIELAPTSSGHLKSLIRGTQDISFRF